LERVLHAPADELASGFGEALLEPPRGMTKPLKIAIRTGGKIVFVDPGDVILIEAQGNYVQLRTHSRSHLLRESVSTVAERLARHGFVRIHRSTIVNETFIEEIQVSRSGEMLLRVKGEARAYSVSRKYRSALRAITPCWI
jgi:DNA-binding LytR/AlgR family response regulator